MTGRGKPYLGQENNASGKRKKILKGKEMSQNTNQPPEEFITECPLVSIIIPVYNVGKYLEECLDNVIAQTYRNLEIILVDDGSTDDSGSICDRYAKNDSRIHVIHSPNKGLSAARNLGMSKMKGSYICFHDSDDWMDTNAIETLVNAAVETKADIVSARIWIEYANHTNPQQVRIEGTHTYSGRDIITAFSKGVFGNEVWNKLYRRECFEDIRFPVGWTFEDIATLWKVMKNLAENGGCITAIPVELFHFRIRKSSTSHAWSLKKIDDCWKANRRKYQGLREYEEHFIQGCFVPIRYMWIFYKGFSKEDKAKAKKTVREMQTFSRRHFKQIMKGDFSKVTKLTCLLAQSRGPAALWAGYCSGKVQQKLFDKKYEMYE